MSNGWEGLAGDFELLTARLRAQVGRVPRPAALVSDLHNIGVMPGDMVVDSVTGQTGEVLGVGVTQVPSGE
jgi:hypothetical protein